MLVKICGITRSEDATACADEGADMLGFVFAESRRTIDRKTALGIIEKLQGRTRTVGVFQDQRIDDIAETVKFLGLDYAQLHGRETPEMCSRLYERTGTNIIKAVSVESEKDLKLIDIYALDSVSFILLDSQDRGKSGGTGKTFPWEVVQGLTRFEKPILVAGGLSCSNVREVIRTLAPAGVDVSTGVEVDSAPGVKDISKVRRFISEAKTQAP